MIVIAPFYLIRFVDYLNMHYPTKLECYIEFLQGEECIEYMESYDGFSSYAVYDADTHILKVPTQYPVGKTPRFLLESIAHEFWHHIQNIEGRLDKSNELQIEFEAEQMAIQIVDEYIK